MLAAAAAKIGQCRGARVMIDVQDRWPDVFLSVAPRWSRAALHPAIWALRRSVRKAAAACDAIVGVADAYVEDFLRETRAPKITATIPLGVDLAAFDAAAKAGRCPEFTKPAGRVWLAYSGSLNRSYDFLTILHAAGRVAPDLRSKFHIFFTSRGELADRAARVVRAQKLAAVSLTGFLPFEKWAYLLTQCDAGFNASLPASFIYLPNKVFYYFAAGVAVLNTISGQCSRILRAAGCGLDYRPGDVNGCVAAIEQVIRDDAGRTAMARASRRLAETTYDRKLLFPQYAALIEKLGKCAPSAEPRAV
jgi:glycosyltransferase involved in cell wall biosynthesis